MGNDKVKQILERETKGLTLTDLEKEWFRIFSYNDVEKLLNEIAENTTNRKS